MANLTSKWLISAIFLLLSGATVAATIYLTRVDSATPPVLVPRAGWGAEPPKEVTPLETPVPFVVVHHSYEPAACYAYDACCEAMRSMQRYHQVDNGWDDIGYNFAVGGDGRAYEGRGWDAVGAHAPVYNYKSVGICLIGDWRFDLPPVDQLETVKSLINFGVQLGKIRGDYVLVGHRQVKNGTECPGERLYEQIQTWEHFSTEVDGQTIEKIYPKN
nr:peptidoglycan-recognition protein LB [Lasioderma serricorne]